MESSRVPGETLIHRQVAAARAGTNPAVLARLDSGWAVLAEVQLLAGHALLLPDPVVPDLESMPEVERARFLADMGRLGAAVRAATGAARVNYAILGNVEPALHAHVIPRYRSEPDERRRDHPWNYAAQAAGAAGDGRFDPARDRGLMQAIAAALASAARPAG